MEVMGMIVMQNKILKLQAENKELREEVDYTYKTIVEYENIVGFKVNKTFKIGWDMARTTN